LQRQSRAKKYDNLPMKTARLSGRRWVAIRARVLTENSLCVRCQLAGRIAAALEVDHIQALANGGTNDRENLQGLCKACHADKTTADLGFKVRAKFDQTGRVIW
jgi:5-methylcytosine-specific restriction protein A